MKAGAVAKGAAVGAVVGVACGLGYFALNFASSSAPDLPWAKLVCSHAGDAPINSCFGATFVGVPLVLGALVGALVGARE